MLKERRVVQWMLRLEVHLEVLYRYLTWDRAHGALSFANLAAL